MVKLKQRELSSAGSEHPDFTSGGTLGQRSKKGSLAQLVQSIPILHREGHLDKEAKKGV
jgi:hypothetical protein